MFQFKIHANFVYEVKHDSYIDHKKKCWFYSDGHDPVLSKEKYCIMYMYMVSSITDVTEKIHVIMKYFKFKLFGSSF